MNRPVLLLFLFISLSLALAGSLVREADLARDSNKSPSALAVIFGDGRRLFANQFLAKADAYFHSGNYPSVFDLEAQQAEGDFCIENLPAEEGGHHDEHSAHGDPAAHHAASGDEGHRHESLETVSSRRDWIARLHSLIDTKTHNHLEGGDEKEMLPWIKLAVELDSHNVTAYAVGGYWLQQLDKPEEARAFLREGQRNNPDSYEIYFELGRLEERHYQNLALARRLHQLAMQSWERRNKGREEADFDYYARIIGRLGKIEEELGNYREAISYYQALKNVSPNPQAVQRLIDGVQSRLSTAASHGA